MHPSIIPGSTAAITRASTSAASCHDVSNPVLANLAFDGTPPGNGTTVLPTEEQSAFAYMHVERTFSEFMLSDYGQPGGAPGIGPFASGVFSTSRSSETIATCQDCHMHDRPGTGAKPIIPDVVLRTGNPATTGSTEHPYSGVPTHDMIGGNLWSPVVLASAIAGSPNYDPVNAALLGQGACDLDPGPDPGLGTQPGRPAGRRGGCGGEPARCRGYSKPEL